MSLSIRTVKLVVLCLGLVLLCVLLIRLLSRPSPFPALEEMLAQIKLQDYEAVYERLTDRWRRQRTLKEYVRENQKGEETFLRFGGFIDDTFVDRDAASFAPGEVYIPVFYRIKVVSTNPPKTRIRRVIFKLVYQKRAWRLDGLKVFDD